MTPDNFLFLCDLLYQRSGLVLSEAKTYLVEARLTPFVRRLGIGGLDELIRTVQLKKDEKLIREITDAMTTNESFFFRDGTPFKIFKEDVLPKLLAARSETKKIRIWSAACSMGQEPYTIAMLLKEEGAKVRDYRFDIIGTDISDEVLKKARDGFYTQFEVQRGLPIQLLVKYFTKEGENRWQICREIREMITYRYLNLLDDFSALGPFDVVFCRNVLIYFDQPTKVRVLERISKIMTSDSVLFLGGAETVIGVTDTFKPVPGARGTYGLAKEGGAVHTKAIGTSVARPPTQPSAS